jgi:hypothetical protein
MRRRIWFVCLVCALAEQAMADPMTTRDILYLKQFGQNISSISWCTDSSLTFVDAAPPRSATVPTAGREARYISMLSLTTKSLTPLLVYHDAVFDADCVRGGEYIYASGFARLPQPLNAAGVPMPDPPRERESPFAQFVDIRSGITKFNLQSGRSFRLGSPMLTAPDGNVFAQAHGTVPVELSGTEEAKRSEALKSETTYRVTSGDFDFVVFGFDYYRMPPPFHVYGLRSPENWGVGSYRCPAPRPGCAANNSAKNVVYYADTRRITVDAVEHVVFTVVRPGDEDTWPKKRTAPERGTLIQQWPVVSRIETAARDLQVVGVALDERRCFVLLQPDPELQSNRVGGRWGGRLRVDLYLANCEFANGRLEFGEPLRVGRKQASFNYPRLMLKGEFIVITETNDRSSQPKDQLEPERQEADKERICALFFRGNSTQTVQHQNTLCARLGPSYNELKVSHDASFIAVRSEERPLIVGRDYRNDGTGPSWLNNGD